MSNFFKHFSFLNQWLALMRQHKPIPIDVVNCDGGRKSGKTVSWAIFLAKALTQVDPNTFEYIKASAIVIKKKLSTLNDVFREYTKWIMEEEIKPKAIISRTELNYEQGNDSSNTNYIKFKAWIDRNNNSLMKQGSGWSSMDGEYVFVVIEECYELTADDRQRILEAVRTSNKNAQLIVINICNPWEPLNPYIQFVSKHLPYDKRILRRDGFMWKIKKVNELKEAHFENAADFKDETHLFIHTNWRINPYLSSTEKNNILKTYVNNPLTAPTSDLGIPGYSEQFCYGNNLENIQDAVYCQKEFWCCGGDEGLGGKSSGKTSFVFAGFDSYGYYDVYDVYVWDNTASWKPANEIAVEVLDFYNMNRSEYHNKTGILIDFLEVRVDKCAIAFINALQSEAENRGYDWINFITCAKYPINDRVLVVNSLLATGKFRVNKERCQPLLEELSKARWKITETCLRPKREDKDDHSINAMEYGFENYMSDMVDKEYAQSNASERFKNRYLKS